MFSGTTQFKSTVNHCQSGTQGFKTCADCSSHKKNVQVAILFKNQLVISSHFIDHTCPPALQIHHVHHIPPYPSTEKQQQQQQYFML